MPFWYGSITRLPFIYYVIHLVNFFKYTDWIIVGVFVGLYQLNRVIINSVAACGYTRATHCVGSVVALIGYIIVVASPKDQIVPFCLGTTIIGLGEVFPSMQIYVKEYFGEDVAVLGFKLKLQYVFIQTGVTFAFFLGGILYDHYGINGAASWGIVSSAMELLCVIVFLYLDGLEKQAIKYENLER